MDKNAEQQLRVKVGVMKRAVKEKAMYAEEVSKLEAEIERLGPDHDRYRQSSQALEESKAMLLDVDTRTAAAREDLEDFFAANSVPDENALGVEGKALLA